MTTATYLAFEQADEAAAREIANALDRRGISARLAGADARRADVPGALAQAVSEARAFVALLSPAAAQSDWVRREFMLALNNGRAIVPVLTADIPADSWMNLAIDREHFVDMRGGPTPSALNAVIGSIEAAASKGRVIAMLNIKGGVGKTVLAANLFAAAHLADSRSIAFIDLDPQHNLTQYFLPPAERNRVRSENMTIYSVLAPRGPASIDRSAFAGIAAPLNRSKGKNKARFELIAGDERLFEYTLDSRSERDKIEAFARFQALITMLRSRVDAVVIDANPCATFLTRLAISAADHIVAPVRPEKYSLTGLNMLEHVVAEIRGRPIRPEEFSVVLNGVNDRVGSRTGEDADTLTRQEIMLAPFFGGALLNEAVPYSAALKATPSDKYAVNPINVTAMMRVASRQVKTQLVGAAASILRRAEK
ncbi:MAG: AAA family ATPase [Caulobacterales bacterium]